MIWIVMIIAGIITFSTRFSMFNKSIANKMPVWVETPLHYVPTALLTAIIVPEVLINEGTINFSIFENLRIMAACFAVFIALISRNVIATIASGLICLWLLQWLL
ncbi:AzlD domain-containing protein [Pelagibacterales bacterium]|jgi:branched-subunit amino acid transport protein|nr:AzlD domain-containing protein [Pelagibacterales bacterium]MBL6861412.1 AzlD domain-containing protein [Pelagibacterales bacterium]MDB9955590.1 AzlD domain-containing protein [Pelagibacterales bacterium]